MLICNVFARHNGSSILQRSTLSDQPAKIVVAGPAKVIFALYMVHAGQFSRGNWQSFLNANHLAGSTSRHSDYHDNAAAKSFFQLLKREWIKQKIYPTREAARRDLSNCIDMFYNSGAPARHK